MLNITQTTSPQEISEKIEALREQKGKEKETLELINKALGFGHNFVINLFWEEALTYQHIYMNDQKDKKSLLKMEQSVQKAKFYIEKYELNNWYSRLYRFLGRISDYKGQFKNSVSFYKKSIKYVAKDLEPFRILELKAFLYYSMIMGGDVKTGYELSKKLFAEFETGIGKTLKKNDYKTWAIWRSGLVIRTLEALFVKNIKFDTTFASKMISETEKDLANGFFGYRKEEMNNLKKHFKG